MILGLAAIGGGLWRAGLIGHDDDTGSAQPSDAPSTTAVAERTLSQQTQVDATIGYAGDYTVINQMPGSKPPSTGAGGSSSGTGSSQGQQGGQAQSAGGGIVTTLPSVGQVVKQGQVLYRVAGQPVVLLAGAIPAYRDLAVDDSGADVRQLNADLVALGYATKSQLDPTSDDFSWATSRAVEKLQEHLDVDQTGKLVLGQVVFLPTSARIASINAVLGAPVSTGATVLHATSTDMQVHVDLDAAQRSDVKVGDKVSITLPDNRITSGVVSAVGTVTSSPASSTSTSSTSSGSGGSSGSQGTSAATIGVDIKPDKPSELGEFDQAPAQVTITTSTVQHALSVPVTALLAQSGGGYAVEVVDGPAHHLVPVTLGLFDDAAGLVQVTGSGLAAGQHVVVPGS